MKFITNSFSLFMQTLDDMDYSCHKISLDEFEALKYGAESHINNQSLANILGVRFNPTPLFVREDDCIVVALLTGGKLPAGVDELPEDVGISFYLVEVRECKHPLLRYEEMYLEEEMI